MENKFIFWKKMSETWKFQKKRVKEEGRSYFRSPQKYECHSHIAPLDKKEWHSSFAPYFGSGAQECRSLTHCLLPSIFRLYYCPLWGWCSTCIFGEIRHCWHDHYWRLWLDSFWLWQSSLQIGTSKWQWCLGMGNFANPWWFWQKVLRA